MNRKFHIVLFYLVMSVSFCACDADRNASLTGEGLKHWELQDYSNEQMTVKEFATWFVDENNSLNKVSEIGEMNYKLSYLPAQAMAYLELRNEDYDFGKFQKTLENYSDMSYFNFRIGVKDGKGELLKYQLSSPGQYEERVKYFSFQMEKDICLVQKKDTVYPGLYQFERTFDVAPYTTVMFAFDNKLFNKNEEFTIVYNDKVFEKGFIKFNYKNKQLINLPNITEL